MVTYVLIHSPLVGPLTWSLVADELSQRGIDALVPSLLQAAEAGPSWWLRHVTAVAHTLETIPADRSLVLVGHSGAGVLLPAIRQTTGRRVAAYLFVDASLPEAGKSRLDLFESTEAADRFRKAASSGYLPTWSEEDLQEVLPDATLRQRFVAELRPLPLAVYEEPLPVFSGWPGAPCGYLQLSQIYEAPAKRAQSQGWPYTKLPGAHFHMLVEPGAVATSLVDLVGSMGIAVVREVGSF